MPNKRRKVDQRSAYVIWANPLEFRGNYTATSNNIQLVHWPLMGGLLRLVQRGGDWAGSQPAMQAPPRCIKCNSPPINGQCTKLPITVLLYNGRLLCGFNVPVKGLIVTSVQTDNSLIHSWSAVPHKSLLLPISLHLLSWKLCRYTTRSRTLADLLCRCYLCFTD